MTTDLLGKTFDANRHLPARLRRFACAQRLPDGHAAGYQADLDDVHALHQPQHLQHA